jgi:hypothetical protein
MLTSFTYNNNSRRVLRFILILSSHLHLDFPTDFFSTALLLTKMLHVISTIISLGLRFQTRKHDCRHYTNTVAFNKMYALRAETLT